MSGHRSSRASKFTDQNEINDLVSRLQLLLPQLNQTNNSRQTVSKILSETCCYIKKLQKEVEDLSEKLTKLMDSVDISDIDRRVLQDFLQQ
ncbi:PREDICTED: transcription factor ILI7-like [Lupinus angustifolius]|uniref:transcription factor ILI7-like n=1 Tax=Lupinus angustifolius TaxID=3871 RepID=UPI00092E2659|nr:PREDICTED: transcription factor ILI7-like [Lupinus angustifolius]